MKLRDLVSVLELTITVLFLVADGQDEGCLDGASLELRSQSATNELYESFLVSDQRYRIPCDGVIETWQYIVGGNVSEPFTLVAQIWRELTTHEIVLVGENVLLYESDSIDLYEIGDNVTINIQSNEQIPVQKGDMIGWSDREAIGETERLLTFDEALPGSNQFGSVQILQFNVCSSDIGRACPWISNGQLADNSPSITVRRDYSIQVLTNQGRLPAFVNLPARVTIQEHQQVGSLVYVVRADNSFTWSTTVAPQLTYSILFNDSTPFCDAWFDIHPTTGVVSTISNIVYNPTIPECSLVVEVYQGTSTINGATETLNISVSDVNDAHVIINLPDIWEIDCSADTSQNFSVEIFDPDDDNTDSVFPDKQFNLLGMDPPLFPNIFTMENNTVILSMSSPADWTGPEKFTLDITVSDTQYVSGPMKLTALLFNTRKPLAFLTLPSSVNILENEDPGVVIFKVVTQSADNQSIATVKPSSGFELFNLTDGDITLNSTLDFATTTRYDIEIVASNNLSSVSQTLTVHVGWVNQAPYFTETTFYFDIPEDQPTDKPLPGLPVSATDRDRSINGDWLTYVTNSSLFIVANETGEVYTTSSLVLSSSMSSLTYYLLLSAIDSHGATAETELVVTVHDINNHNPIFTADLYIGSVIQSSLGDSPTEVFVNATDSDAGENAVISFSIESTDAAAYFQIDAVTGEVTLKQPIPDYPPDGQFTFMVAATDQGNPPLNGTAMVHINVTPSNMHAPNFTQWFYDIEMRSDLGVGATIFTYNATDSDPSSVNNISYSSVMVQQEFIVNQTTGSVVLRRGISSYMSRILSVQVTDSGDNKEYFTDPVMLRIDTYNAGNQLIVMTLQHPLTEMMDKLDEFLMKLNALVNPWVFKIETARYSGDKTQLTMYALQSNTSYGPNNTNLPKLFVDRKDLQAVLSSNIYGYPCAALRESDFATFEVTSVEAAYPIWLLETPGGIATLTIVCVVGFILVIVAIVIVAKVFHLCCFKRNKVSPEGTDTQEGSDAKDTASLQGSGSQKTASVFSVIPATGAEDMFELSYGGKTPSPLQIEDKDEYVRPKPPVRPDATIRV